jgi:hypothetical protein
MFTTLAVAMTLSGAVAVEAPVRTTEAARPALVQLAAKISGGGKKEPANGKGGKTAKPTYTIGKSNGGAQAYGKVAPGNGKNYPAIGAQQGYGNGPVTIVPKEPLPKGPAGNGYNNAPQPNNNGKSIDELREIATKKG